VPLRCAALSSCFCLLACLLTGGCAFDDGHPWGNLTLTVDATGPMALRTADGVTVELETVALRTRGVMFYGADDPAASFDPSDPPHGCTLCHGGHCHCGDELVPYADLAARTSAGPATPVVTLPADGEPVGLRDGAAVIPLAACTSDCPMPRGALTRVEFGLTALRLVGQTADGVRFDGWVPMDLAFSDALDLRFDRGEPISQSVALTFGVPASVLDGVEWPMDGELDLGAAAARIRDNVATDAVWSAASHR